MTVARFTAIVVYMAALYANSAMAAGLSPDHWPTPERAEIQQREFFGLPPYAGPVSGRMSLVAGTLSPVAVHAGVEALRRGGTAADAAATVALTQVATAFGSVVSYAGISELLYFDAKSGKVYALDAGWGSYTQETDPCRESSSRHVADHRPRGGQTGARCGFHRCIAHTRDDATRRRGSRGWC